jgi:hypothetical protein
MAGCIGYGRADAPRACPHGGCALVGKCAGATRPAKSPLASMSSMNLAASTVAPRRAQLAEGSDKVLRSLCTRVSHSFSAQRDWRLSCLQARLSWPTSPFCWRQSCRSPRRSERRFIPLVWARMNELAADTSDDLPNLVTASAFCDMDTPTTMLKMRMADLVVKFRVIS